MEMKVIYKYYLQAGHGDETNLKVPSTAKLLTIQDQGNDLAAWFEIPLDDDHEIMRTFFSFHTGVEFDKTDLKFIKTVVFTQKWYVAHIYEKIVDDNFLSDDEMTL